ncbi:MAG: hypothetical protein HKO59_08280, partial [Phycisphaerales bacterium]|nr:hypothetical protein [Phycisphaerales bacterium]
SGPASGSASAPAPASASSPAPAADPDPIEIATDVRKVLFSTPVRETTLPPVAPASAAEPAMPAPVKLAPKTKAGSVLEPKGVDDKPAEPVADGGPVPLATHVAGLHAIAPRCPGHERVELALDAKGRIHLLGSAETMRAMPVVETWAHAHRELIDLACPHHEVDPRGVIVCHLFGAAPLDVADLHASRIHLHVLAPVDVAGKRGWYAAPLNDPPLPV